VVYLSGIESEGFLSFHQKVTCSHHDR